MSARAYVLERLQDQSGPPPRGLTAWVWDVCCLLMDVNVVTGGAGFVGSNLCRVLLDRGALVICIDNLTTGGLDRIRDLMPRKDFRFIRGDATAVLPTLKGERVTHVWALAALASPVHYFRNPLATAWAGAEAQRATLEFAADHAARFFYSSTSELYSGAGDPPFAEDRVGALNPMSLRSPYDVSKLYGEVLCAIFFRECGLDVRIARYFNLMGPGMPISDGRVVPAFLGAALRGDPVPVHGTGGQTRSFCYISDGIAGSLALMDASIETFRGLLPDPPIVNIGNPVETTMKGLAAACWAASREGEPKLAYVQGHPDDPPRRVPDITRARELLKWEPKVGLDEALRRTASWLREAGGV